MERLIIEAYDDAKSNELFAITVQLPNFGVKSLFQAIS